MVLNKKKLLVTKAVRKRRPLSGQAISASRINYQRHDLRSSVAQRRGLNAQLLRTARLRRPRSWRRSNISRILLAPDRLSSVPREPCWFAMASACHFAFGHCRLRNHSTACAISGIISYICFLRTADYHGRVRPTGAPERTLCLSPGTGRLSESHLLCATPALFVWNYPTRVHCPGQGLGPASASRASAQT